MYYPLIFKSVYKEMVWGGTTLRDVYSRDTPFERTGESWDITCREGEMGIVSNGTLVGAPFISVIKNDPIGIMGENYKDFKHFPLLVKLIDASDFLSVQVHPNDGYAQKAENYPFGKNEMWYVLSALPGSYLILGTKDGVTKEVFKDAVENGETESCLNRLYVSAGDIIDIPAGLIHAVGKGIVLAEVQQNSDITYRVYDYDRIGLNGKKRELHIEKSLDVIDFSGRLSKKPFILQNWAEHNRARVCQCVSNPYFSTFIYDIESELRQKSDRRQFSVLTCVKGSVIIEYDSGAERLYEGTSVFIPAALGDYDLTGAGLILASTSCA